MSTFQSGKVRLLIVRHGETDCNVQGIIQGQLDTDLNQVGRKQAEFVGSALSSEAIDEVYTSPLRRAKDTADAIVAAHHHLNSNFGKVYWLDDRLKERGFGSLEGRTFDRSKPKRDSMDGIEQMNVLFARLASFLSEVLTKPAPFTLQENLKDSSSDWKDELVTRPATLTKQSNGKSQTSSVPHRMTNGGFSRTILFVSHGAAISALLALLHDMGLATLTPGIERTRIWNCSITTLTVDTRLLLKSNGSVLLQPSKNEASQKTFTIEQWADVRHIPNQLDDSTTKTGNADEMVGK